MIRFKLNNAEETYTGDVGRSLLDFLRTDRCLTAAKDGCSAQGVCGACTVEVNGEAKLACLLPMHRLEGRQVFTMEGFPEYVRDIIARSFVSAGAVQCGFCIPGFIVRVKILLQKKPLPSIHEVRQAIRPHLCRCTGYKKIEEGIIHASQILSGIREQEPETGIAKVGISYPKYQAYETAIGKRRFVDDMFVEGMFFAALKFSDHPKATINHIEISEAKKLPGVIRVFTARDIPAKRTVGLIYDDWPVMIAEGETTHCIGDVLAGVVAETEDTAREAIKLITVDYTLHPPVTDVFDAIKGERVHPQKPNLFDITRFSVGDADAAIRSSAYTAGGRFSTQRVEHAFLEKESALAIPDKGGGLLLYTQSQGVYVDRRQIAPVLGIEEKQLQVIQVACGGAFGGKEDLSIQAQTAMFTHLLKKPVKLTLTRSESIRLHPKRHPVVMDITLAADRNGKITALKLTATGDTGAYASVGTKVMERVAGHAAGGYYIPNISIEARTVYTNNIPSGAMRGFGANQVNFALESCIDDLCYQAGFDRWQIRYDNALTDGLSTATGHKVSGSGIRACLEALKAEFRNARFAGLATAIKNSGVGNGMIDESKVVIDVISENEVLIKHGWTEMGQGVHTIAIQTLCNETNIDPSIVRVEVNTIDEIVTGMTTSSRATALLGLAIINAAQTFADDLKHFTLKQLAGKTYRGAFVCDWTTKPGTAGKEQITHYSYGYAAQLCILNDDGSIQKIIAAHDGGKIFNPGMFEGQVQGGVHMGLGYALSENLPMEGGYLVSDQMKDLGILRAHQTPDIEVRMVEVMDPVGPYGAKGVGEIGLVPTASAVANAFYNYDGIRRMRLPLTPVTTNKEPAEK